VKKLLKKRSSKFLEVGLRPKRKVAKYSGQPPKLISPYALAHRDYVSATFAYQTEVSRNRECNARNIAISCQISHNLVRRYVRN
jgi:hypothetical protein